MPQDIRCAFRQLARRPGFAIVATLILGVGIAANTTIWSAARATMFAALPFEHEARLVRIYVVSETGGPRISLRPAVFEAVRDRASAFDAIAAQRFTTYALSTEDGPERVIGIAVSEEWGVTLGVTPALGRLFSIEEEALGEDAGVVVLSHGAWERRYGGSESALGSVMLLDSRPHTVVGVMPAGFNYPYDAELWVPMRVDGFQRGIWAYNAPARLKPGWTVERAREDLRAVTEAAGDVRELRAGLVLTAVPIRETLVDDEDRTLVALLGAVGFFLLLVCANLATLLHARALGRSREFALRTALGASRRRLFRQVLVEAVVLASFGGVVGVALAALGMSLVGPLLPGSFSNFGTVPTLDAPVLAVAGALSLVSGVLLGLLPAARLTRPREGLALQSSARSTGTKKSQRLERGLVIGELAIALALLAGIGLMLRDFQRLHSAQLGYEPAGLTTFSTVLNAERYGTPESRLAFTNETVAALRALPGVTDAGLTTMFPSARGGSLADAAVQGRERGVGEQLLVHDRIVTPGFLDALGPPLVRGRTIDERDVASGDPVVVISERLADRLWPGEDPLGRRVRNARDGDDAPWMRVVGVVGDVREFYDVDVTWYRPYAQHAESRAAAGLVFAVRGQGGRQVTAPVVREAITAVDPELPVFDVISATDLYAESFGRQGHAALLGSVLAAFALGVAAVGLYGSVSHGVSRRTREIGIRMALGSSRETVLRAVVAEGGRLVAAGLAIGAAGTLVLGRFLSAALTEVGAFDLASFTAAALVLAAAGVVAAFIPALRATRIDPLEALQHD